MGTIKFNIYKYPNEGSFSHTYSALQNILESDGSIKGFTIKNFKLGDLNHPVSIECQPSYDGTVNLLMTDDLNPPRIINTRFSKIEDNRFKIIKRNQINQTNLYKEENIDETTRLIKSTDCFPVIDLNGVETSGQLKGGIYTFYLRLSDEDDNKTNFLTESGQIIIYKGTVSNIGSIVGTMQNEVTDKTISLRISNLDKSYSRIYLYYTREFSDTNGVSQIEAMQLKDPIKFNSETELVNITGYEDTVEVTVNELNIQYNLITAAKTEAQVQNMLFFGNVQKNNINVAELQKWSYKVKVTLKQSSESIGWINSSDYSYNVEDDQSRTEYYSPWNNYYRLGYWPDEIYRLGIVYILNDNSLTPVFNLKGCEFTDINQDNDINLESTEEYERDTFITNEKYLNNTFGVFKLPKYQVINYSNNTVKPLYFNFELDDLVISELKELGVKGYFLVRQKRIANTLGQGLALGIDGVSYIPMLYELDDDGKTGMFFTEGFLSATEAKKRKALSKWFKVLNVARAVVTGDVVTAALANKVATSSANYVTYIKPMLTTDFESRKIYTDTSKGSALLTLDCTSVPELKSRFDGSEFVLRQVQTGELLTDTSEDRHFYIKGESLENKTLLNTNLTYVQEDTKAKYVNGYCFASKCGAAEDVSQFSFFSEKDWDADTNLLLRGNWTDYLGVNSNLIPNSLYEIKIQGYSESKLKDYFTIRKNDTSPFYAISNRVDFNTKSMDCYRGDCYTNTITIRLNRNFIDGTVPINDTIIDPETWYKNYKGYNKMVNGWNAAEKGSTKSDSVGDYSEMNRGDINAVPMGMWVTFKCLSSYNLGIRCIDHSHIDEEALLGNPRTFFPNSWFNITSSGKGAESKIVAQGYGKTLGKLQNFIVPNVPYLKELFDNRIMFSDVQTFGKFENSFRIFKSLDYQDIERQYGAIVKLIPWGNNLLCVFEHGVGLVPVNEKALLATQSGQSIHMYGAGVLQNQVTVLNPDFGSIWQESIIKTPVGVYGVDTTAKKIWVVGSNNQMQIISDMKIQQFLNNYIKLSEADKYPTIGIKNVKTHYNNNKGDVMFTFYNESEDTTWNMCYNERMGKWITRYSWTPLYSENIDNIFYSLDQNRAKVLAHIYDNKNCNYGVRSSNSEWILGEKFNTELTPSPNMSVDKLNSVIIQKITTSYLNDDDENINVELKDSDVFEINSDNYPIVLQSKSYDEVLNYFKTKYNIDFVPVYFNVYCSCEFGYGDASYTTNEVIGIVLKSSNDIEINTKQQNAYLRNGFYIHGRSGIFDEIDYEDAKFTNQILPTKWYETQEPFEMEFVVNQDVGAHKIFDNLVIISNNVQPKELEFTIEGDVYGFNKAGIFRQNTFKGESEWDTKFNPAKESEIRTASGLDKVKIQSSQEFKNVDIQWDTTLNNYYLNVTQECKNINKYGRRLGNIQYKEDSWYLNIEPIRYRSKYRITSSDGTKQTELDKDAKSTRIRDKYCKVRVKYSGKDLVIITALQTLYTLSYS